MSPIFYLEKLFRLLKIKSKNDEQFKKAPIFKKKLNG